MVSWMSPRLAETLGEVIDAVIALAGADFGNIQLLDNEGRLRIVAQRNFPDWWLRYWETEAQGQGACGAALAHARSIVVEDVERSPIFAGTPALEVQRRAGVRAVHSIPLSDKQGRGLGVFSTHYRVPHTPTADTLTVLNLLARHASTLAEQARDEHLLSRSETRLGQTLALLEGVMQTTDVMLVLLDAEFNFVWVNEAYARTCGMRPEDMIGRNHFILYPHPENEAIFRRVRDTGTGVFYKDKPFEFPDQPERGTTYWDWSLAPVKDAAGAVTGLVFSLRETTPYKLTELALAGSEQRYRDLVEQVQDGIFVADAGGRYTDVNQAGVAMLGYSREEMLGLTLRDLLFPEEAKRLPEEIARLDGGSVARSEWRIRRKDGSGFIGEVLGRRLPDGRLLGVLRDITERRQMEEARIEALARQRDALVREVHHRIKNHLQGAMGLLSAEAASRPDLAAPLAEVAEQIRAIATVYGLQASRTGEQIALGCMVDLLAKSAIGPVPVECRSSIAGFVGLADTYSIPLALVINELVVNALKHLDRPDPQRPVRVLLEQAGTAVRLEVCGGPAYLPDGFDFERQEKTGLGLELAVTLLSSLGTRLSYEQRGNEVCATLWLEPPAISLSNG
jgi:PAS domain S-box-containing protein